MSKPNICVLLSAYNGETWLNDQLDSILNQTSVSVKIFISVDISVDSTYSLCCTRSRYDSRIIVLPYGSRFGSAGRNFFHLIKNVDVSSFDFVAFSDQDDIWLPSKLINAVIDIKKSKCDAYSGNVTAFWPNGSELLLVKSQPQKRFDHIFESAGPGCSFVFNIQLALQFKQFIKMNSSANNFILHDWFLYAFARSRGFKWYIDSNSYVRYRQHENNQIGANGSLSSLLKRFNLSLNGSVGDYINQLLQLISDQSIDQIPPRMDFYAHIFFIKNWRQLRRRTRDSYFVLFSLIVMLLLYYPIRLRKIFLQN